MHMLNLCKQIKTGTMSPVMMTTWLLWQAPMACRGPWLFIIISGGGGVGVMGRSSSLITLVLFAEVQHMHSTTRLANGLSPRHSPAPFTASLSGHLHLTYPELDLK